MGSGFGFRGSGFRVLHPKPLNRLRFRLSLGRFQVGSYRYRSLIEALYTLNSPPVVSFSLVAFRGSGVRCVGLGSKPCKP